jgi:hypothetical protein
LPEINIENWPFVTCGTLKVGASGLVTNTEKFWVVLKLGTPLSATLTDNPLLEGAWAMPGRQVNKPLVGSMLAPTGATGSAKVNVCPG